MNFGALIIGDEILSGKRVDLHFNRIVSLLAARGLRLSWAEYLGDERSRIAATLKRSFAAGDVVSVSYTHLDVYKRQALPQSVATAGINGRPGWMDLFSSHPPIEQRIAALASLR